MIVGVADIVTVPEADDDIQTWPKAMYYDYSTVYNMFWQNYYSFAYYWHIELNDAEDLISALTTNLLRWSTYSYTSGFLSDLEACVATLNETYSLEREDGSGDGGKCNIN